VSKFYLIDVMDFLIDNFLSFEALSLPLIITIMYTGHKNIWSAITIAIAIPGSVVGIIIIGNRLITMGSTILPFVIGIAVEFPPLLVFPAVLLIKLLTIFRHGYTKQLALWPNIKDLILISLCLLSYFVMDSFSSASY
jgi:hypothetical protein